MSLQRQHVDALWIKQKNRTELQGVARIFSKKVTLGQSEGIYQIVMSFLPPVVRCLLKKGSQKGGGGLSRAPQDPLDTPPLYSEYLFILSCCSDERQAKIP